MCYVKYAVIVIVQLICLLEAKPYIITQGNKGILNIGAAQMPEECLNQNYCTEPGHHYPTNDMIDHILFNMTLESMEDKTTGPRQAMDTWKICLDVPKYEKIFYIVDDNGRTRHVVQTEKFIQKFDIVRCQNPGPVNEARLPLLTLTQACEYEVTCEEQLVSLKFLVLTLDGRGVEVATIKDGLPMACTCKYTYPGRNYEDCFEKVSQLKKPEMDLPLYDETL